MGASGVVNAVQGNIQQQYQENANPNNNSSHMNISNVNMNMSHSASNHHHMSTSNAHMSGTPSMAANVTHQASSSSKSNLGQMEIEDECNANAVD